MEIRRQIIGNELHLSIGGRIDATWSGTLDRELTDAISGGAHHIRLDLRETQFISSAGIRALLKALKTLAPLHGSFAVTEASENVRSVLDLTGLTKALEQAGQRREAPRAEGSRVIPHDSIALEVFPLPPQQPIVLKLIGNPDLLADPAADRTRKISLRPETMAVGIGAFGDDARECRQRFGECLAVCGAAACLPTEKAAMPDFLLATPAFAPEINFIHALSWPACFAHLLRFESRLPGRGIALSDLVKIAIDIAGQNNIAAAILAETTGLVGVALRRSPSGEKSDRRLYEYPEIKKWFSFSAEPVFNGALALGAGIAARAPDKELGKWLRPLGAGNRISGHFHGAVFERRPLKKGMIDLAETTHNLFQNNNLRGIMHLLADERELTGAGESRFSRGAVWIGPVEKIINE